MVQVYIHLHYFVLLYAEIRDAAVAEHNKYRARHGAQALQGDATVCKLAQP